MHVAWKAALGVAIALGVAGPAGAQNLTLPASGLLILDLAGTPINTAYTLYFSAFTATTTASTVTFVFRHDPGFFAFDDASVVDATIPGGNLLLNPGFELGAPTVSGAGVPGWTYFEQAGLVDVDLPVLGFEAAIGTDGLSAHGGGFFWDDGATGGYDGIDQTFATTVGNTSATRTSSASTSPRSTPTTLPRPATITSRPAPTGTLRALSAMASMCWRTPAMACRRPTPCLNRSR